MEQAFGICQGEVGRENGGAGRKDAETGDDGGGTLAHRGGHGHGRVGAEFVDLMGSGGDYAWSPSGRPPSSSRKAPKLVDVEMIYDSAEAGEVGLDDVAQRGIGALTGRTAVGISLQLPVRQREPQRYGCTVSMMSIPFTASPSATPGRVDYLIGLQLIEPAHSDPWRYVITADPIGLERDIAPASAQNIEQLTIRAPRDDPTSQSSHFKLHSSKCCRRIPPAIYENRKKILQMLIWSYLIDNIQSSSYLHFYFRSVLCAFEFDYCVHTMVLQQHGAISDVAGFIHLRLETIQTNHVNLISQPSEG